MAGRFVTAGTIALEHDRPFHPVTLAGLASQDGPKNVIVILVSSANLES